MTNVHKITEVTISTKSTEPLRGMLEIDTVDSSIKFELNEDVAHSICASLEHFLTQRPQRTPARLKYSQKP